MSLLVGADYCVCLVDRFQAIVPSKLQELKEVCGSPGKLSMTKWASSIQREEKIKDTWSPFQDTFSG